MKVNKLLVIRFSSIGDIVLTTPIVRCIKTQMPDIEIHYLTKKANKTILEHNPYIDKVYTLQDSIANTIKELKAEHYDFVVDLHKNLRSKIVKLSLAVPSGSFRKLNIRKWLYVTTKHKGLMPDIHIVDRYFDAVKKLNIKNDNKGLDYFCSENETVDKPFEKYVAIVCGANHTTKQIPPKYIAFLIGNIKQNIVLLGDKNDARRLEDSGVTTSLPSNVANLCGKCSLAQSAIHIKNSTAVITADTGLMHIAAAYKKKIITIWGNTTPQLGMYPYMPQQQNNFVNIETDNLKCRPCSKLGYQQCPKKHFNCMNKINWETIPTIVDKMILQ